MQARIVESIISKRIDEFKDFLNSANQQLEDTHQQILNLKREQVTIYQKIAAIFLLEPPENDNQQIQMLITQLHELFAQLKNSFREFEQLTLEYQGKLSNTLSKIDKLTVEKAMLLESDSDYLSLFERFKEAEESLEKEALAFNESQREFSQKLAQYHQNRCYHYLIKRGFGEKFYRGFWIFRNLDAWVARYINFAENYKNQKILESLLKESQYRYDNKKELYQLIFQQKEQKEQEIENKLKLPQLSIERIQVEQILASYQKKKEKAYQDLNNTERGQGNQFHKIANQLADIMQQQSISTLERLTLQTKSIEDDILLQTLSTLQKQIHQLEMQLSKLKQNSEALEQTYNRFNQVFFIFKKNNIPSDFYEYDISSSNLNGLLDKLLDEAVFPETIVHAIIANRIHINRNHSSSSGWSVGWGSSSTTPRSSHRRPSSSGFSSGSSSSSRGSGFSSTSSSGGGGFKTTDSF
ncbi:hypothetical protein RHO12_08390 [Orbus sturtevantii]|uniref:hypothetical protein n=1 Tax=Orbus sturtevantii TaxID=3074109 RepID=UPI00370DD4B8